MIVLDVLGALFASLAVLAAQIDAGGLDEADRSLSFSNKVRELFSEISDGYKLIREYRGLFALLWCGFVFAFAFSPLAALFPIMTLGHFGGSTGDAALVEILFSAGMSGKKKSGSARAVPRAYGRLTRHERDTVQRMLERRASCREIARELGRSPSTVSAEVASHRFVTAPKARRGERVDASADLSAACPRLAAWPRCCNGCGRYRAIGCKRRPHVFYEARAAQLCADSVLVSSRRGIDADEPAAAARLEAIRDCLRRGLSPEQMAARNGGPVDLSPSTIYRWVSAGYDGMATCAT